MAERSHTSARTSVISSRAWPMGIVLMAGFTCVVWAAADDFLTLKISTALTQDNNFFRLPQGADTNVLIGRDSAKEQIAMTSTGITLKLAHSLQQLVVELQQVTYHYQNFGYLNNTASNYTATWRWGLTPRLHGNISSSRQKAPESFSGEQDYTKLNLHTSTESRVDATYDIDGAWRLMAAMARASESNLQNLAGEADNTTSSAEAGVEYEFTSGNTLTYGMRNTHGTYQNRVIPSNDLYDDSFSQMDHKLSLRWSIDGKTTADLRAMMLKRSHPNYPQRDYQGVNAAVGININLTGKTSLNLGWSRDLSSYQTSSTNFSQSDRLSLGSTWKISPKTQLRLRHEISQLDYLGTPALLATVPVQRADNTQDTMLSLEWQPYTFVVFTVALQKALRSSNVAGLDYESYLANISAQFIY